MKNQPEPADSEVSAGDAPMPGDPIAKVGCPVCGARLEIEHGDEPGETAVIGTPTTATDGQRVYWMAKGAQERQREIVSHLDELRDEYSASGVSSRRIELQVGALDELRKRIEGGE